MWYPKALMPPMWPKLKPSSWHISWSQPYKVAPLPMGDWTFLHQQGINDMFWPWLANHSFCESISVQMRWAHGGSSQERCREDSFMHCEMFGLPCWCRVLRLFDVFSLQFVARETWSDSSDYPDWTLSDINHDHSTMNLVALQKQWEQNRSDVSKAHTTWFDSLQYWHRLTLGRSYLYAGN